MLSKKQSYCHDLETNGMFIQYMSFFLVQVRLIFQATYCIIEGDISFPILEEIDMSFDTKSFHYITYFHYVIHYIMYIKQSTTANKFSIVGLLLIWLIDIFDQALRIHHSDSNRALTH